jgi:hypothetical protein
MADTIRTVELVPRLDNVDMSLTRVWQGDTLGAFTTDQEADAAVSLAQLMSDISERCYYAGWEHGTEHVLWAALRDGPRRWGVDAIRAKDLSLPKQLSEQCGGVEPARQLGSANSAPSLRLVVLRWDCPGQLPNARQWLDRVRRPYAQQRGRSRHRLSG